MSEEKSTSCPSCEGQGIIESRLNETVCHKCKGTGKARILRTKTKAVRSSALVRPLAEIVAALNARLKEWEENPLINTVTRGNLTRFYGAAAWKVGRWVLVQYISYQNTTSLSRSDADKYLRWIEAGGVGRHHEALRERPNNSRHTRQADGV